MVKRQIVNTFCEWAAFSSTRAGSPLKSRADVYPLIRLPKYHEILSGRKRIGKEEFEKWHESSTQKIIESRDEMNVGWASKIINVYLKGKVYIANEGRDGLIKLIHPPIDTGLWNGVKKYCNENGYEAILQKTNSIETISGIRKYSQYRNIIDGLRELAENLNCHLIEVEQLWLGTEYKK